MTKKIDKKCKKCGNPLNKKQKSFCSRRCSYNYRTDIVMKIKHRCTKCRKEITGELLEKILARKHRRWVCTKCKRKIEKIMYHKLYKADRHKQYEEYYRKNAPIIRQKTSERGRARNKKLREMAIEKYGGKCECCGETKKEFLCIDHKNGGGSKWRRQSKKTVYLWAYQNNYPKELRILCHNCNSALGFYGYCPHQRSNEYSNKN